MIVIYGAIKIGIYTCTKQIHAHANVARPADRVNSNISSQHLFCELLSNNRKAVFISLKNLDGKVRKAK